MKAYLEPDEVGLLEKAAKYLRDKLLIRVLFHLGCRISEALAITVQDIDFDRALVRIEHLKTRIRLSCPQCNAKLGKAHLFCPKCGTKVEEAVLRETEHRRMRTLPIDQDTLDMLREYIDRGGPVSISGRMLLFGINRHRAWQIVRDAAARVGLPTLTNPESGMVHGVSPHRLRDAFAVNAVKHDDSGDGVRLLQEHLGHQSIVTTMKYRKVSGKEHKEWYDRIWSQRN